MKPPLPAALTRSDYDSGGPNADVAIVMDVVGVWELMLRAIATADAVSPLNK